MRTESLRTPVKLPLFTRPSVRTLLNVSEANAPDKTTTTSHTTSSALAPKLPSQHLPSREARASVPRAPPPSFINDLRPLSFPLPSPPPNPRHAAPRHAAAAAARALALRARPRGPVRAGAPLRRGGVRVPPRARGRRAPGEPAARRALPRGVRAPPRHARARARAIASPSASIVAC